MWYTEIRRMISVPLFLERPLDELVLHEVPKVLHLPDLRRLDVHVPDLVGELVHVAFHGAVGHCNKGIMTVVELEQIRGAMIPDPEPESDVHLFD